MKVKFFLILLVLGFCLPLSANQKVKLLLNWKPEPQFGGFYEAQIKDLFKKNNLEVEILPGGSGTPTIQMLGNKKVDFAIVSAEEIILFNAKNNKDQVLALFATYQKNPQIIMTHAEKNFTSLKQVFESDGVLAVQSGLLYFQYLDKKYQQKKVRVVPYLGGVASFIQDANFSQQGFLTAEPLLAEKANIKTKNFLIADEGFNPYTTVLATHIDNMNRLDLLSKVYQSVKMGWQSYLSNPLKTNEYMQKLNPSMSLQDFTRSSELQKPLIVSEKVNVGEMSEKRWLELIDQIYSLKFISKKIPAKSCYIQL